VATIVTIVNNAYADDRPGDHDDLFIVKPIDRISEMQTSLFKMAQALIPSSSNKYHQDMILATIQGIEAIQILEQLEVGNGIRFDVSYDETGGNPVIELVKVTNIEIVKSENNIPDDKRGENLKKGL